MFGIVNTFVYCLILPLAISSNYEDSSSSCVTPSVTNGQVESNIDNGNTFLGRVKCDSGYELFGEKIIKCRNGVWSADLPLCTKIGGCNPQQLPDIVNGRKSSVGNYRGSVFRYKCKRGYRIFGQSRVHCNGNKWSLKSPPVCTRPGCDLTDMETLADGSVTKMTHGAVLKYKCDSDEAILIGSTTLYCDGHKWNDTKPQCLSPPTPPELSLTSYNRSLSTPTVLAGQLLRLTCVSTGGSPSPQLQFVFDRQRIGKRRTDRNVFEFRAAAAQNGARLRCLAHNQASNVPVASQHIQLTVLFPPGKVNIAGPKTVSTAEDKPIPVVCQSSPSNPATTISFEVINNMGDIFMVNSEENSSPDLILQSDFSNSYDIVERGFVTTGRILVSASAVKASSEWKIRCLGEHQTSTAALMMDEITLKPEFSPKEVYINGPKEIPFKYTTSLRCTTTPSMPPAKLKWKVTFQDLQGQSHVETMNGMENVEETQEGFVTKSEVSLAPQVVLNDLVNQQISKLRVECSVDHPHLQSPLANSHSINLLYPPGAPEITGLPQSEPIESGSPQHLTCLTKPAGQPPAQIIWSKGDQIVESQYSVADNFAQARLTFIPETNDNGAVLKCQVYNDAIGEPLTEVVVLKLKSSNKNDDYMTEETTKTIEEKFEDFIQDQKKIVDVWSNETDYQDSEQSKDYEDSEVDDDYDEYYDDDYYYEYPDQEISDTTLLTQPELLNEDIYKHKISLETFEVQQKKKQKETENSSFNEVYPKDSPYTQSGQIITFSWGTMVLANIALVLLYL